MKLLSRFLLFYHRKIFDFKMWVRLKFLKMSDEDLDLWIEESGNAMTDIALSNTLVIGPTIARISIMQENVRQQQENKFWEEFCFALTQVDKTKINWTRYKSKDFILLMASVIERAHQTTAKEKLHRFQDILIKDLQITYHSDFKDTFLDLILRLNEDQIKILYSFKKTYDKYGPFLREGPDGKENQTIEREKVQNVPKAEEFKFNRELYLFYLQDLISKSLLFDDGMGRAYTGPFKVVGITEYGLEFLKFIETNNDDEMSEKNLHKTNFKNLLSLFLILQT